MRSSPSVRPPSSSRTERPAEARIRELQARLQEAEETLEAIRSGSVDALVVRGPEGERVYTLTSADRAFRELAERMSDGAATVTEEGTIAWANQQLARLTQRPLEKLIGDAVESLLPGADIESSQALLEEGRVLHSSGEIDLVRRDGSTFPARVSITPVTVEGVSARAIIVTDITEQRGREATLRRSAAELERRVERRDVQLAESRQALRASEDRMRRLLEAVAEQLPVGILVAGTSGRIIYGNREAERIWGGRLPVREPLRHLGTVSPDETAEFVSQQGILARALKGEHVPDTEIEVQANSNPPIMALVRAEPIRNRTGGVVAAVGVAVDITARRQAEAIRDAFIDVTAHELKTPLTTLYGVVQTLVNRGSRLSAAVRIDLLGDAMSETERLVHLVDDMLVLSRVERGVSFVVEEPLLLDHLAAEVLRSERRRRQCGPIGLRVPDGPLPVVRGESTYVGQVIANMLRNAAKYGQPPVEVVVERREDGVALRVLDSGPGFTSDPSALFDLFYRETKARQRASGGGIGLFVCRELVRLMGGRVWAVNRPEGGAEFGFLLPLYEGCED